MKLAIVCDWLTNLGGSERTVLALHHTYPEAPIYTSVYNPKALPQFKDADVRTSFLQRWPLAHKHQLFPTLRTRAFESFDLSAYDVVISATAAEAKGVITRPQTLHIGYIYTPVRYYWSKYHQYLREPGFGWLDPLVRLIAPPIISKMRQWDYVAAQRPEVMVGISTAVAERINKYYQRPAKVLFPPVDIERFKLEDKLRQGFVTVARLTAYKKIDLAVKACKELDLPLTVIGNGPELKNLQDLAGAKTTFITTASDEVVSSKLAESEAFLFPGEEDFGITILEAQACGTPVIAYAAGGALDTVVEGKTGLFFQEQTVNSLISAIKKLSQVKFDPVALRAHAAKFSAPAFSQQFRALVDAELASYRANFDLV